MEGNRRAFCFLLQEKARLFLAPFSTNQIFFSFSKPCVWQASDSRMKIRARILNTFAFLLGVSFVCLPLPGCLPCLRIVDFFQILLSSQRKLNQTLMFKDRELWSERRKGRKGNHPLAWGWLCIPTSGPSVNTGARVKPFTQDTEAP